MEGLVAAEQFGVELREFFQVFLELLIGRHALLSVLSLPGRLEQKLQDVAWAQATDQIVKGTMFFSLGAEAQLAFPQVVNRWT